MIYEPGRICVKIAGRDAGKKCVILEHKEDRVLIDGETRRRYVNPDHLEPTDNIVEGVSKDTTASDIEDDLANLS